MGIDSISSHSITIMVLGHRDWNLLRNPGVGGLCLTLSLVMCSGEKQGKYRAGVQSVADCEQPVEITH